MSTPVRAYREAASFIATFAVPASVIGVDTTNNRILVGDGTTLGGNPAAKLSEVLLNTVTVTVAQGGTGTTTATGTGSVVKATSPSLTTPVLNGNRTGAQWAASVHLQYNGGTGTGLEIQDTHSTGGNAIGFTSNTSTAVGDIALTATTTAYNSISDGRFKTDHRAPTRAGSIIDALRVSNFKWKTTGTRAYGVVAQQAVRVFPDAVSRPSRKIKTWRVDYSKFVPLLIVTTQDLRARLKRVERDNRDLRVRMARLERQLERLQRKI